MKQTAVNRFSSWEIAKRNAWVNAAKVVLVLLHVLAAAVVWDQIYVKQNITMSFTRCELALAIYTFFFVLMCHAYDAFRVELMDTGELAYSLSLAQLITILFQYLLLSFSLERLLDVKGALVLFIAGVALNILWSGLMVRLYRRAFPPRRTYVICDHTNRFRALEDLHLLDWKFQLVDVLDISSGTDCIQSRLRDAEAVILINIHSCDRNRLLKYCIIHNIQVYIRPKVGDLLMRGGSQLQLLNVPMVRCGRCRKGMTFLFLKRTMDIVFSGLALILLSPVMAVTAVLIRRYDHGPALYRQTRLTQDGREFEILKFRSMRMDAEKDGVARLATENDDRITPIGRFIRAIRLDELPQLINIIKGDMSLVGPRPERPELAAQYEKQMPEFGLRLQVKAGLTGYAQVYGKYNTRPYEKLQMDLLYIARQSVLLDLKLMFLTVKILFQKESTEGIEEGNTSAMK